MNLGYQAKSIISCHRFKLRSNQAGTQGLLNTELQVQVRSFLPGPGIRCSLPALGDLVTSFGAFPALLIGGFLKQMSNVRDMWVTALGTLATEKNAEGLSGRDSLQGQTIGPQIYSHMHLPYLQPLAQYEEM